VSLGDRIIERVRAASLEELARAAFLVPDETPVGEGDAERVATAIHSALGKKNQFAASEPKIEAGVKQTTAALFAAIASGTPRDDAFAAAKGELAALFREALGEAPREVTAAKYSPELQLSVLGLSIDVMREPILDIGCGEDAALVRFLREAKKRATGIDREAPLDVAERADWLTYEYGNARFGTIVSHLGFSLHFMHQEMKASELAFEYARVYMHVLKSLARGGTFAYVPGLPFIEAMLPKSDFGVTRVPLARDLFTENVARVQEATGLVLDSATHVTRRV
jgi:hypothetical protein